MWCAWNGCWNVSRRGSASLSSPTISSISQRRRCKMLLMSVALETCKIVLGFTPLYCIAHACGAMRQCIVLKSQVVGYLKPSALHMQCICMHAISSSPPLLCLDSSFCCSESFVASAVYSKHHGYIPHTATPNDISLPIAVCARALSVHKCCLCAGDVYAQVLSVRECSLCMSAVCARMLSVRGERSVHECCLSVR